MEKIKNCMRTACIMVFAFCLSIGTAFAQTSQVKGRVVDSQGQPIPGVNVVVKGTTTGTITDFDGNYTITVNNPNDVLTFSFIGYNSYEAAVNGQSSVDATLQDEFTELDDVVVVGYGVVKKSDLTGSVSSVKTEDLQKVAASNAMQAMQAKVPGMDIQQASGESGASVSMSLRGSRSISASNSPLVIVDGVEYGSTLDINPSDIESMEILKDASSTAIYGTKGANGVILITTKRGKAGNSQVYFNSYWSINKATSYPNPMYGDKEVQRLVDGQAYDDLLKNGTWGSSGKTAEDILATQGVLADGTTLTDIYKDKSYTDWMDQILKNGFTQNYEVGVNGGSENTTFSLSAGVMQEKGLMENDQLMRYNLKASLDHSINDYVKAGASVLYTFKNHNQRNTSLFSQAMKMTTLTHAYLENGEINSKPSVFYDAHCSPLLDEVDGAWVKNTQTSRFFGNAYIQVNPIKDLTIKSLFALDRSDARTGQYQDGLSVGRFQTGGGAASISNSRSTSTKFVWDNTINYHTDFNKSLSDLTVLIGSEAIQTIKEGLGISGTTAQEHYGTTSQFYDVLKITAATNSSSFTKSSMMSVFGRINYKLMDRYLLTASLRGDGSSVLADGNKWGCFPSVALGWRILEESFMENTKDVMSNLKLRLSWGKSGNAAIDPYQTLGSLSNNVIYNPIDENTVENGKIPTLSNKDLSWETTSSFNVGLDFGILDNRISGSVDFYVSKTKDLLYLKNGDLTSGYPSAIANVGETKGSGIEVSLQTLLVKAGDFEWNANWSYSHSKDEISKLSDGIDMNVNGTSAQIVGEPISIYFDYEADGIWGIGEFDKFKEDWTARHPGETLAYTAGYGQVGTIKLVDRNDDGKIDDNDKKVYNRAPKHILGMNNSFSYKNWSLDVLLFARLGGYMSYDLNDKYTYDFSNWGDLDYWTPTNTGAKFPAPSLANNATSQSLAKAYSTALKYEKANYFKVKDITLSYNLHKAALEAMHLQNVKVYASLKNFVTVSSVKDYDAERGGALTFPLAKQVVFGLNIQF